MGLAERIQAGYKNFTFSAFGGNRSYGSTGNGLWDWISGGVLPGSNYDYRREAGILWENSVIHTCLQWIMDTSTEAMLVQERPDDAGKFHPVPNSELVRLLNAPNPDYDGSVLEAGLQISYYCDGNAYVYIDRSRAKKAVGLYYVPHFQLEPRWSSTGSEYIGWYEYTVDGKSILIPKDDIIHIRNGVDPANTRKGLSRLKSELREVCTDNEAATLVAALLRNNGIPGVFIGPKYMKDQEGNPIPLPKAAREKFRETWSEKFGGDRRGEPFVTSLPLEVTPLSFNPQQLDVAKIRHIPEERITAAFGLPTQVVGLGAGLEHGTYNNYQTGVRIAYNRCLRPLGTRFTRAYTHAFKDEPGYGWEEGDRLVYDYSGVAELAPDVDALHRRCGSDFQEGLLTLDEARADMGLDPVEGPDRMNEGLGGMRIWDLEALKPIVPAPTQDDQAISKRRTAQRTMRQLKRLAAQKRLAA